MLSQHGLRVMYEARLAEAHPCRLLLRLTVAIGQIRGQRPSSSPCCAGWLSPQPEAYSSVLGAHNGTKWEGEALGQTQNRAGQDRLPRRARGGCIGIALSLKMTYETVWTTSCGTQSSSNLKSRHRRTSGNGAPPAPVPVLFKYLPTVINKIFLKFKLLT